jgi:hypothetical protein
LVLLPFILVLRKRRRLISGVAVIVDDEFSTIQNSPVGIVPKS